MQYEYESILITFKGETLYAWSLRYVVDGPAYELWLETKLDINPSFDQRVEEIPRWITFYWSLKVSGNQRNLTVLTSFQ